MKLLLTLLLTWLAAFANLGLASPTKTTSSLKARTTPGGGPCRGQGAIFSPKEGQTVDITKPLEIIYCSDAFNVESRTLDTQVLWSNPEDTAGGLSGLALGQLRRDSDGFALFRASVTLPSGGLAGTRGEKKTLYVYETKRQQPNQPVTFSLAKVTVQVA